MPENPNPDLSGLVPDDQRDALFTGIQEGNRLRDSFLVNHPNHGPTTQIAIRVPTDVVFDVMDRIVQKGQDLINFPKTRSDLARNAIESFCAQLIEDGFLSPDTEIRAIRAQLQLRALDRLVSLDDKLQKTLDAVFKKAYDGTANLINELRYKEAQSRLQTFFDDFTIGFLSTEPDVANRCLAKALDEQGWKRVLSVLEINDHAVRAPTPRALE